MNKKITKIITLLFVVVLSICMTIGCGSKTKKFDAEAFKEGMKNVLASSENVTGDKAITLLYEKGGDIEGEYTQAYVPEEYVTDQPAEVRYVISRKEDSEFRGTYMGAACSGHRYKYTISVRDLKNDVSVENIFYGGEPPTTISVKPGESKVFYGSKPSEETILEWVLSAIQEVGKKQKTETVQETVEVTETESVKETETPIETEEPKDPKEAALKEAQELLDANFGLSASDLEQILVEYEGVSSENAKYAVEHCEADWKQEALECAINYDGIGFSYVNMRETLKMNHGFTKEEAQYAVDHCGNDWKKAAVDHIEIMMEYEPEVYESYTREEMIAELVEIYWFTEEEAIYGVDTYGFE